MLVKSGLKIAAFSVALAIYNYDVERYEELPDWDKDAYWHFWIGGEHFTIPKPFEIGVLFATIPERVVNSLILQTQGSDKLLWSIKHNLLETLGLNPTPQLLRPGLEAYFNYDMWRDRKIESEA